VAESKRVLFSFNDHSYDSLEQMKSEGQFSTLADVVWQSLVVCKALQSHAKQGFTEVTVHNPETGEERILSLPKLVSKDMA
jgi:hypothetical protein